MSRDHEYALDILRKKLIWLVESDPTPSNLPFVQEKIRQLKYTIFVLELESNPLRFL